MSIICKQTSTGYLITVDGISYPTPDLVDLSNIPAEFNPKDGAIELPSSKRKKVRDAINTFNYTLEDFDDSDIKENTIQKAKELRDIVKIGSSTSTIFISSKGSNIDFYFEDKNERDIFKQVMDTYLRNLQPLKWHPGGEEIIITETEYNEITLDLVVKGQLIHKAYLDDKSLIESGSDYTLPNLKSILNL